MTTYRSIFLEPDWAHTLYYGWREVASFPEVTVLRKDFGPASRLLVLSEAQDGIQLDQALGEARAGGAMRETIVHDFGGSLPGTPKGFRELPRARWMLNGSTLVIDLTREEGAIYDCMAADTKRRVLKAERAKVRVEIEPRPEGAQLRRFFDALQEMHRQRGLHPIATAPLQRMFEDGRALLLSNESRVGPGAYLMLYLAGDKAIWLHGVGRGSSPDSGQLLQWRAIQTLKANGIRWYDLGGVPADPASGIRRYKEAFGGEFVPLGNEFVMTGPLMALARRVLSVGTRIR